MTWRDTCAQLAVARDAFMEGRWAEAKKLADEVAPDCEWVRHRMSRVSLRGWRPDTEDDYDYMGEDVDSPEEQRQREVQRRRALDWFAWLEPPSPIETATLASLNAILKQHYSPDAVAQMASQSSLSSLRPSGEALEFRVRSYANITRPGWNAVFNIPDDD